MTTQALDPLPSAMARPSFLKTLTVTGTTAELKAARARSSSMTFRQTTTCHQLESALISRALLGQRLTFVPVATTRQHRQRRRRHGHRHHRQVQGQNRLAPPARGCLEKDVRNARAQLTVGARDPGAVNRASTFRRRLGQTIASQQTGGQNRRPKTQGLCAAETQLDAHLAN